MKKKLKKEIIEWIVILAVLIIVINTNIGTKIASYVQKGVLHTGLVTPSVLDKEDIEEADYNFSIKDIDGNKISFDQFKGKTIFMNFWATWCPPCIAEMPDIHELRTSLRNRDDIIFIMISMDRKQQKAKEFMVKENLDLPVYFLNTQLPEIYDTHSIPTTYVISPQGKIVAKHHGIAKYNSEKFTEFLMTLN